MSNNSSEAGPRRGWTIIGQQEASDVTPTGQVQQVVRVTFQLADGQTGTVTVPAAGYGPDVVRDAVTAKAAAMYAVADLTG